MYKDRMVDIKYFRCPRCYNVVMEESEIQNGKPISPPFNHENRICAYCDVHKEMDSLDILRRQLDCLDNMYASDFPKVLRRLARHASLRRTPKGKYDE